MEHSVEIDWISTLAQRSAPMDPIEYLFCPTTKYQHNYRSSDLWLQGILVSLHRSHTSGVDHRLVSNIKNNLLVDFQIFFINRFDFIILFSIKIIIILFNIMIMILMKTCMRKNFWASLFSAAICLNLSLFFCSTYWWWSIIVNWRWFMIIEN